MFGLGKKQGQHSTMSTGAPAPSDRNSLTTGPNGSIVLHDHQLVETLQHFNRMNIPERRPHAKGAGAFGVKPEVGCVEAHGVRVG